MLDAKKVLVVAPHADDETIGAGGTLLELAARGATLHWLIVTTPRGAGYSDAYCEIHARQAEAVAKAYPMAATHRFDLPASSLQAMGRGVLVDRARKLLAEVRPDVLLLPHAGDAHDDHTAAAESFLAAAKSFRQRDFGLRRILAMEILSETDAPPPAMARPFLPTTIVDISASLQRKLDIMALYASELTPGGPRDAAALAAQAKLHGASYGLAAAERFMLLREILS